MNKKTPMEWVKEKISALKIQPPGKNNDKKPVYLLILLILGALFMIIGTFWKDGGEDKPAAVFQSEDDSSTETFGKSKGDVNNKIEEYEIYYESQLKDALESIVGVSDVTVVVNVESTEKKIIDKNTVITNGITQEEDGNNGTRKTEQQTKEDQTVIINDEPIVLETRKPEIKGVLVVAGGAENLQVAKWIREAVTRSLDVPSHRVSVLPKKSKGDS